MNVSLIDSESFRSESHFLEYFQEQKEFVENNVLHLGCSVEKTPVTKCYLNAAYLFQIALSVEAIHRSIHGRDFTVINRLGSELRRLGKEWSYCAELLLDSEASYQKTEQNEMEGREKWATINPWDQSATKNLKELFLTTSRRWNEVTTSYVKVEEKIFNIFKNTISLLNNFASHFSSSQQDDIGAFLLKKKNEVQGDKWNYGQSYYDDLSEQELDLVAPALNILFFKNKILKSERHQKECIDELTQFECEIEKYDRLDQIIGIAILNFRSLDQDSQTVKKMFIGSLEKLDNAIHQCNMVNKCVDYFSRLNQEAVIRLTKSKISSLEYYKQICQYRINILESDEVIKDSQKMTHSLRQLLQDKEEASEGDLLDKILLWRECEEIWDKAIAICRKCEIENNIEDAEYEKQICVEEIKILKRKIHEQYLDKFLNSLPACSGEEFANDISGHLDRIKWCLVEELVSKRNEQKKMLKYTQELNEALAEKGRLQQLYDKPSSIYFEQRTIVESSEVLTGGYTPWSLDPIVRTVEIERIERTPFNRYSDDLKRVEATLKIVEQNLERTRAEIEKNELAIGKYWLQLQQARTSSEGRVGR